MPSTHVAKQYLREIDNPDEPPVMLCAINALTPKDMKSMYAFHALTSSAPDIGTPGDIAGARHIVGEDVVILEALQRDYDEHGDTREVSVAADKAGVIARRIVQRLIDEEVD